MPIAAPTAGNRILAAELAAFYQLLKGVLGSGEQISLVYNAEPSILIQPSTDPAAGTGAVLVKNVAGAVLSRLNYDGSISLTKGIKVGVDTFGARGPGSVYTTAVEGLTIVGAPGSTYDLYVTNSSGGSVMVVPTGTNIPLFTTAIAVVATPATGGYLRLPFGQGVVARNFNNTYNEMLIGQKAGGDVIQIGAEGGNITPMYIGLNYVSFGASPAATGIIRIPNNAVIYSRNAANTADVPLLWLNASNQVQTYDSASTAAHLLYRSIADATGHVVASVGYWRS